MTADRDFLDAFAQRKIASSSCDQPLVQKLVDAVADDAVGHRVVLPTTAVSRVSSKRLHELTL